MKKRLGFVSNSSSSSFLIPIMALEPYQIEMIKDHITATEHYNRWHETDVYCADSERWDIGLNEKCIYGYTFMDNFDMHFFLTSIAKIDEKYIYWEEVNNTGLDIDELNRQIVVGERKDKLDNIQKYGE